MRIALCLGVAIALSSTAFARDPRGDEKDDTRKTSIEDARIQQLSDELQAQRALLDSQRVEIESLKSQKNIQTGMSLNDTRVPDSLQSSGQAQPSQPKPGLPEVVKSKWGMNVYGFVEADFIYDSVNAAGINDGTGNPAIPRPGTAGVDHGQTTFGARNSRIGFNVNAPEYEGIRASAKLEMDFLGVNAGGGGSNDANGTWVNPTFRIRHMYLTLDSDIVTFTFGQGWELFGWQPYFHPCTVDIQGVPGQVYSRSPKMQISHKFRGALDIEVAAALSRPPDRDAESPDIQAGLKLTIPDWVGVHTMGAASTAIDAAGLGISGTTRAFRVSTGPTTNDSTRESAVSLDLFIPILHPDKESRGNSLSFTGSVAYGAGFSEEYSGFNMGVAGVPGIVDQGSIAFRGAHIDGIQLMTDILGLQYYLPGDGTQWIALTYGATQSNNISKMGNAPNTLFAPATVFKNSQWIDASLFWDVTPAVRLGLSFEQYRDTYIDEVEARDTRIQFSAFYLF